MVGAVCPNCGMVNRPGAKFCSECATPLGVTCPTCGTENAGGAKFCSECATPLIAARGAGVPPMAGAQAAGASPGGVAPGPPGFRGSPNTAEPISERRLVSILFADLVGFTPFAEERDTEDVRETLSRYFEVASEVITRHGGTVEKFIGDAVMAVWGTPVAREDDAERSVRAALELVEAVRSLGSGIQARAGVLTGESAVTIGATNQGMVAGDIVNTASRLQSVALPGTVLVGEATQRAAATSIIFEPAGEQVLKGKAAPVPSWRAVRVVSQRGGRGRADALEAPFVGRDEELRQLKDLFHATGREGRTRLVSVIGPAGIGKTRLAWEFLKYVDGLVENVWWHDGRSPAYGDGITFWSLGEMIRGRAGLKESDDEATTRLRVTDMVRQYVPDTTEQAWVESALLALLGIETGMSSDQLFAAWRTFFERLAASGPVVLVFEDLHHADAGTLDFIDHVLEWSRGVPIYVLTLARPELLDRRRDWGAGTRSFASIHLEPLPPAAMMQLLLGLVPGIPAHAIEIIVARADGIPLYAIETVRMLLSQGRLVAGADGYRPAGELGDIDVPETLTALIAARLDALDPIDRGLMTDAAVLGQSFSTASLSAVGGLDPSELDRRLRDLVRRELLVLQADPRSPERGQYLFVQALIREVAYNTLARRDRKIRHLAAARFFEALGSDELAGALAGHYRAAQQYADGPEADALATQARLALRGAAERAASLGSHEQALTFLDQAIAMTSDPADVGELETRALRSARAGTSADTAERHARAAVEAWRAAGDREVTATAIGALAIVLADFRSDPGAGLALLQPAWQEFEDLMDGPGGLALMAATTRCLGGLDRSDDQLAWAERALPIAERLGDMETIVNVLAGRSSAILRVGRPIEARVLLEGAFQLALTHDLQAVEIRTRNLLVFYGQWDEPARALELAREGQERARRLGSRGYSYLMVGNGVSCALRAGDWTWADEQLEEWLVDTTDVAGKLEFLVDRAILSALRGRDPSPDIESVTPALDRLSDPQYRSYEQLARAWIALVDGRLADAASAGEEAVATTSYFAPIGLPVAARASLWDRDGARAARTLATLDASGYYGAALAADQQTIRAGLAALEGRTSDAIAGYREALRAWRSLRLVWDEALVALDMAILLGPDEPEAAAAAEVARDTLVRLDARPFLARLDQALRTDRVAAASVVGVGSPMAPSPRRVVAERLPG